MISSSSSKILAFGLVTVGLALVAAGAMYYRRRAMRRVASEVTNLETEPGSSFDEPGLQTPPPDELGVSSQDQTPQPSPHFPWDYFGLVFALTIPFWMFGGRPLPIPMKLPISALSVFNPLIAALILTYRQRGVSGIRSLLKRAFDYKNIQDKLWYLPVLFLFPGIAVLSYAVMRWMGQPLPEPEIPWASLLVLFPVTFIAAIGEELGWMGYAIDPMQKHWGALQASIGLGIVWGVYHLIPDLQNNQTADWILWQRLGGVAFRILMVWVYNNTGKSVFTAILFHVMNNLIWALFPNNGSHYSPFLTLIFTLPVVIFAVGGWGSRTLADRHKVHR